jgi:hypothetical protein
LSILPAKVIPRFRQRARTAPTVLFQPRPSGWIDLKPLESAHFIVGASCFPQDSGPWRQICDIVETLELKLTGENQVMSMPFGVGTCAQVNISAWRAGSYDDDPQNLIYAKSTSTPQADLPKQCAAKDVSPLGRPVIVTRGTAWHLASPYPRLPGLLAVRFSFISGSTTKQIGKQR